MSKDKRELKKKATKAIIAASTASGIVVGGLYSSPEDLIHPKPVIMNIDEDEDFYDEHVKKDENFGDKLRNYINNLPLIVRITIVLPFWAIGFVIIALCSNLWKLIGNPLLSHLSVWAVIAMVMLAAFAIFGKIMYPKIPIKKFINKNTLIITGVTVVILCICHLVFPNIWDEYESNIRQVQIAAVAIALIAGSYQLYHDFYQTKLVVSGNDLTFES